MTEVDIATITDARRSMNGEWKGQLSLLPIYSCLMINFFIIRGN